MIQLQHLQFLSPAAIGWLALGSSLLFLIAQCIYLRFFHPLAKFPGPVAASLTEMWKWRSLMSGKNVFYLQELHEKYGDVIRIAPNELSYASLQAYRDIYGHKTTGKERFLKSDTYDNDEPRISSVRDPVVHAEQRKALSHAFSARALRDQEDVVHGYVDLFIKQLGNFGAGGLKPINVTDAYNWLTFDIIGDLSFGEPFGALETGSNHWVKLVMDSLVIEGVDSAIKKRPWLKPVISLSLGRKTMQEWQNHSAAYLMLSREKAQKRIEMGDSLKRVDFFGHLIKKKEISQNYLMGNAQVLLAAGSETTATSLAGTTWYLLQNQDCLRKLTDEIRGTFKSMDEITGDATARCEYLHGVIEEGLRLFPPVAHGLPRVCPGAMIDGQYVPAGCIVACENYPLARDPRYWVNPDLFQPERWIGEGFGDDKRAFQPFSSGPRACIGINLAYVELRITLAKMIFAYDMELVSREIEDWNHACLSFGLWRKPDLLVKFHPRQFAV
ncbi:hypothetical protein KVR01_006560 [Diaporthe batatas]|uniref:uncharacterized protein n=1 Tax=Diaporthe batatas TaxID=748121 RepID=UPI001D04C495|nr:uncharacterized protein KVR01_006560 [Diaporthe batatas]KAG8163263.1 hypothetical protein KVR01_006560 [Diaporthe batatas]